MAGKQKSFTPTTVNGHSLFLVSSALQKAIRRGLEDDALYWAVELFESNYDQYAWKRMKIISSEDINLAEPNISSNIKALEDMYMHQRKNRKGKKRPERIFLVHAILLLCRAKKSRVVDHNVIHHWRDDREVREIPDYAFDKHNYEGKRMGRGWQHFFDVGTLLSPLGDVAGEDEIKRKARAVHVDDEIEELNHEFNKNETQ